jgi:lysophospholipase L1-like esterase
MKATKTTSLLRILFINLLIVISMLTVLDFVLVQYYSGQKNVDGENLNRRSQLAEYEKYDWANDYWTEHMQFRNTYKSFVGWKGTFFQGKAINVDTAGFRKTLNNPDQDISAKIAFLGGSTMWGFGVNDENTIPSQFAWLADSLYSVNLGQLGYTAYQSYLLLQLEVDQGRAPDIVISYDGANDTPAEKKPYAHLWEARMQKRLEGMDFGNPANEMGWMQGLRTFAYKMRNKLLPKEEPVSNQQNSSISTEANIQAATELLQAWKKMKLLCDANGIEFYCILQPQMHVGSPDLSHLDGTDFQEFWNRQNDYVQYYDEVLELINSDEFSDLKNHFIDLRMALDGLPGVYMDVCHLMPEGNKSIAKAIARQIR